MKGTACSRNFQIADRTLARITFPDVNGGQQILLRLRPHWAPNTFYSEEELIGVMLHEVCPLHFCITV